MRPLLLPALAAVVGAGFSAALLRKGVVMGPDSWAYWEGSVSLLENGEYAYFGGERVTSFPPLFSWLLVLVQAGLGVSARSLAIALSAFVSAASFAWMAFYVLLRGRRQGTSLQDLLAALYVPATLAIYAQTLLSESLWLVLLPILLLVVAVPASPGSRLGGHLRPVVAWLVLSAMLLCRNATVSLLPAVFVLFVWLRGELPLWRRLATASVLIAAAVVPWYGTLRALGQQENHPLGTGHVGLLEPAREMVGGVAYALGPDRWRVGPVLLCAMLALIVWEVIDRTDAGRTDRPLVVPLAAFAALGLAGLVWLFSLTHVGEPLGGRFVSFAALSLGLVTLAAGQPPPRGWRQTGFAVIGVLLTAVALYRVGIKYRLAGIEQPVVALDVMISSSYWIGPPRTNGASVLVAPPTYAWQRRGGKK